MTGHTVHSNKKKEKDMLIHVTIIINKTHFLSGGGWGEGTQQNFIYRGSALRPNPLPFYKPFLTEKVPLYVYLTLKKWYPFYIPTQKDCVPFLNPWNEMISQENTKHYQKRC